MSPTIEHRDRMAVFVRVVADESASPAVRTGLRGFLREQAGYLSWRTGALHIARDLPTWERRSAAIRAHHAAGLESEHLEHAVYLALQAGNEGAVLAGIDEARAYWRRRVVSA